ncbi:MAG: GMC family oxidoreductase [Kofleriaceae bacterium]|nr:GMC family oxidoreductase [Kofleriaceae bacterium]
MTAAQAILRDAVETHNRPRGVIAGSEVTADAVIDCDVVVVGSGAGGATMAAELAEAGADVIVVEEGGYYSTRDFTANASAAVRQLYRDGGATLALGNPPVMFQEGRVVGGSTVINGGMSWRTPERILDRWYREAGIDEIRASEMESYFARVEQRINVAYQDEDSIGLDNKLLKKGAEAKGWKVIPNLRNQLHCVGSNNCAFGCPTGAKQSALVTYVPRALHFGAQIYADARAEKIIFEGKRAVGVQARIVRPDGRRGPKLTVRAKLVVSSCGAIHTPALLARSGVVSPSGQLGRNLSLHPNTKVVAIFDQPVRGWEGVHQAFQVREFHEKGLIFAAVNVPPGMVAMSMGMRGAALGEVMKLYDKMMVTGMLLEDTSLGSVRTVNGRPQAFYQLNDFDAENLKQGVALLAELLFAAGAKRILPVFDGGPELHSADDIRKLFAQPIPKSVLELFTVHMMGTAAMGADRSRAVTNGYGLVHDTERLMIADASTFPTPIGVNPMETIMALATRSAGHIIDNARTLLS